MFEEAPRRVMLKFVPLQSCVDLSFWKEYGENKLNLYKLSEEPVHIQGFYEASQYDSLSSPLQVDGGSFLSPEKGPGHHQGRQCCQGVLLHCNTMEAWKGLDRRNAMKEVTESIWRDIQSGAAEASSQLLNKFLLLVYGDLKQYRFHYWFCFPALKPPNPFYCTYKATLRVTYPDKAQEIANACDGWWSQHAGVVGRQEHPTVEGCSFSTDEEVTSRGPPACWLLTIPRSEAGPAAHGQLQCHPVSRWREVMQREQAHGLRDGGDDECLVVVPDPCHSPDHPGWPLRNILMMMMCRWDGITQVRVLCLRKRRGRMDVDRSLVVEVPFGDPPLGDGRQCPDSVGWEVNDKGVLAPRCVDVRQHMSPLSLAEQAVDLNLRLMRWRAAPALNLDLVAKMRCLLLGAGTLGCTVSRTLLSWGVRHITLVDSGRVAFSNPVRQWLYEFEDCLQGGRAKAQCAADHLAKIFPAAVVTGLDLRIQMPGHPPGGREQEEAARKALEDLEHLVAEHDVVFLLTDTRESRWLPTLLATCHGKMTITAALGYDSYLVMRHGLPLQVPQEEGDLRRRSPADVSASPCQVHAHRGQRPGCYFCNDVVAPMNSTLDRALDQQCTVARPGLSAIAGALAVELMATLTQCDQGPWTPLDMVGEPAVLGAPPHMIRGELRGFQQSIMRAQAFSQCTACSDMVVEAYRSKGWDFVLEAMQRPSMLEELTGLHALHQTALDYLEDDEIEAAEGHEVDRTHSNKESFGEGEDWTAL